MKPLNYAILSYFTTVEEASVDDVLHALSDQYGTFKAFNKNDVLNALMTAEANGLLEESRFDFDENKEVKVWFRANADGAATIKRYIKE